MQRTRTELKGFFKKHAIPTESNFADFVESTFNQAEDGFFKPPNDPLSIKAVGPEEGLIHFYREEQNTNALTWRITQKPTGVTNPGLSIHEASGDSRLFIESGTGNIGIGTPTPTRALSINTPGGSGVEGIGLSHGGGESWGLGIMGADNSNPGAFTLEHFNADNQFQTRLLVDTAGNVGIGTSSPNRPITIHGAAGTYMNVRGNNGTHELLMGADNGGGIVSVMTNHDLQLRAGGNITRMTIKADGKVGIGTPTPGAYVHMRSSRAELRIENTNGSNWAFLRIQGSGTNFWDIGQFANNDFLEFRPRGSSTNRLVIKQNGSFGIGTTAPATKLQVNFVSGSSFTGTAAYGGLHLDQDGGSDRYVGITASATSTGTQGGILIQGSGSYGTKLRFLTTDSYAQGMKHRMTIDHKGNVGINTTAPSTMLHINSAADASLTAHGCLILGSVTGTNLVMDNNEIIARVNGRAATLHLNTGSGQTSVYNAVHVSSREIKEGITALSTQEATALLQDLDPVIFTFKTDPDKRRTVGFIAEEAPDLVATADGKAISYNSIVAMLSKVVRTQQGAITALREEVDQLKRQREG